MLFSALRETRITLHISLTKFCRLEFHLPTARAAFFHPQQNSNITYKALAWLKQWISFAQKQGCTFSTKDTTAGTNSRQACTFGTKDTTTGTNTRQPAHSPSMTPLQVQTPDNLHLRHQGHRYRYKHQTLHLRHQGHHYRHKQQTACTFSTEETTPGTNTRQPVPLVPRKPLQVQTPDSTHLQHHYRYKHQTACTFSNKGTTTGPTPEFCR